MSQERVPQTDKIVFVTSHMASFIRNDIEILSEKYEVVTNIYNWKRKSMLPFLLIQQFFFMLKHRDAKFILISFGGWWAWMPSVVGNWFDIPVATIVHGADCAAVPSINYGGLLKPLRKKIYKIGYKRSDILLPVSESLMYMENDFILTESEKKQGLRHFYPKLKTPHQVIFNGLDNQFWQIKEQEREPNSFITVMYRDQFERKGGPLMFEAAIVNPDCVFYVAGTEAQEMGSIEIPSNVNFLGRLKAEELRDLYNRCEFVFQLSVFEGFGCALVEAMLCGCIPVVASSNMLPVIAGESGFVVERNAADRINMIMEELKALSQEERMRRGVLARKISIDRYTLDQRKRELYQVIEDLKKK